MFLSLAFGALVVPQIAWAGRGTIDITYVGNEGFLISCPENKVLVDALYRKGVQGYVVLPRARQEKIEQAKKPFNNIDLVLTTHEHGDHFDAGAVGEHLAHNTRALFVSTPDAVITLRAHLGANNKLIKRIRSSFPVVGQRTRFRHNGINLEVLNIHHGRGRPVENLGFVFELGGGKFLHIGDSQGNSRDFRRNNLHRDTFDFAFIPYWYLAYEGVASAIHDAIHARHIIVMHVPPKGSKSSILNDIGGWEGMKRKIKAGFPDAIIFEDEMETRTFSVK